MNTQREAKLASCTVAKKVSWTSAEQIVSVDKNYFALLLVVYKLQIFKIAQGQ